MSYVLSKRMGLIERVAASGGISESTRSVIDHVARLDERAFAACYQHNSRALWSYLYRVTGKASDADDLVQDAFCRLLQADVGALADEELRRYVFRIASNLMADRWRRSKQEQSLAGSPARRERGRTWIRSTTTASRASLRR